MASLPKEILERFRPVLNLPDEKLRGINQWVKSNTRVLTDSNFKASEIRAAAADIGIDQRDLLQAISFLGTLMFGAEVSGSADAEALKELGLGDLSEKAAILLHGIQISAEEAEYSRQKGLYVNFVMPTLESVDVLCDLRAIFRRLPSPSRSEEHERDVKVLLGFEPMVLVSLELNDAADKDSVCAFQVPERGLRSLIKTLQEALIQVEMLKESNKALKSGKGL